MDSPSALEEEALAIVSIYGPSSFFALTPASQSGAQEVESTPVYALKVSLEEPDFDYDPTTAPLDHTRSISVSGTTKSNKELELRVYFPKGYPDTNTSSPVHEVVSIYYGTLRLTNTMVQEIDEGLKQCFVLGEVVVFAWIEWLRAYLEDLESREAQEAREGDEDGEGNELDDNSDDDDDDDNQELHASEGQRAASDYFAVDEGSMNPSALSSSLATLSLSLSDADSSLRIPRPNGVVGAGSGPTFRIQSGAPIVDRKSVFVAHLAPITQPNQVPWMIQQLKQENKKVVKATHNIMAFRVEIENGTIAQDNDDDGETAAGSRLLHLMSILDVKNVVVVVSRWYGGIPLSADRFKHINNAARLLLDECGYIKPSASSDISSSTTNKKKSKGKKTGKR
ncbi:hypothetical protein EDD11_009875 [Mortierella claussenii]|nr:hypothetical protein EDD11_009875 [Mortierella claussenii]